MAKRHDFVLDARLVAEALARDDSKRLFAALAHRARTPLATLRMNAQALVSDGVNERDRTRLERILRSVEKLDALFATSDNDEPWSPAPLDELPVAARDFVERVVGETARDAEVRFDGFDEGLEIAGDARFAAAALAHFVTAAFACGSAATPREFACRGDGDILCVETVVVDAGGADDRAAGLDFRLYLVGRLAERHGGRLEIAREEQGGPARMTLALRLAPRG